MVFSISFLLCAIFAAVGTFALIQTILKVPLPQKWVWIVGFGILAANGIANALYQYGGMYIVLLPALYPLQAALETTATLGLVIGAYSALNKDEISSHWYSLPTGCTPIAMLAQYFPTYYVQIAFVVLFTIFVLVKSPSSIAWLVPFGLLVASSLVQVISLKVAMLSANDLSIILLTLSTLILAVLSIGGKIQIGKTKLG